MSAIDKNGGTRTFKFDLHFLQHKSLLIFNPQYL